jgi:hypothetical protein
MASELEEVVTLIVMVSLAPEAGEVVEAVSVVREAANDEVVVEGHEINRLYRLTEPRPEASS